MKRTYPQTYRLRDWVEILRSGKYKQGTASLKHRNKFCCLGVLCDVAGVKWDDGECVFSSLSTLSQSGLKFFGLTEKQQVKLVTMNDTDGKTFLEIADYIEQHIVGE